MVVHDVSPDYRARERLFHLTKDWGCHGNAPWLPHLSLYSGSCTVRSPHHIYSLYSLHQIYLLSSASQRNLVNSSLTAQHPTPTLLYCYTSTNGTARTKCLERTRSRTSSTRISQQSSSLPLQLELLHPSCPWSRSWHVCTQFPAKRWLWLLQMSRSVTSYVRRSLPHLWQYPQPQTLPLLDGPLRMMNHSVLTISKHHMLPTSQATPPWISATSRTIPSQPSVRLLNLQEHLSRCRKLLQAS
jgi:hypothetical protein